jgi:hypothetical protein
VAQQRFHRHRFVSVVQVRRQEHLVAQFLGCRVDPGDEFGFEELSDVHQNSQRAAATTRE